MRHRPHPSAPPDHHDTQSGSSALRHARQQALRLDRAFLTSNATGLAVTLVLGATAGDLLARRLPGTQVTVGLVLYLAQVALLLVTARRFDRRSTRLLDPWQQAYARSGAGAADGHTGDAR
ncbi:hypothetical protein ACFY1L_49935 [Streptomyces sp. NPDC001663]|uniref:hypothetical protein n=1 Tax=Streptomyces sp. NPDC001663 TaxID=3364597 RepID=UPI003688BC19